jgi:hypothetical protein
MQRAALIASFLVLAETARAAEPDYPREVARWQEVSVPPESDQGARMGRFYAANYSNHAWRVYANSNQICARLAPGEPPHGEPPKFTPKAGRFHVVSSFAAVDDGWLVGFNQGEFGAALYWFSRDGKRSYKVSDHQVVDFFSLAGGLHAIEGLAHMGMSEGTIIRVARPQLKARWQASTVTKLPFAPYAISVRRDGTMLVTLSDSLVSIGDDRKITTLLPDAPWGGLYPDSSVLSPDQQKLYIGMRQFVGEFDITTKKLRLFIPSPAFLNKLPKEDEQRIRKQYGG